MAERIPDAHVFFEVTRGPLAFDLTGLGFEVYIDGVLKGRAPLYLSLEVGMHKIEFRPESEKP